jgi:ATP-dependent Clp protease ATP-binding subunit ClpC
MKELSFAASAAWQLSALEAAAGRQPLIEAEHLLIGICSLEKIDLSVAQNNLDPLSQESLQAETAAVEEVLGEFEIDPTSLRRSVRQKLGIGNAQHEENMVHRSPACKRVFRRASELARAGDRITCLHLMAAIFEQSSATISSALEEVGVKSDALLECALAKIPAPSSAEAEPLGVQPAPEPADAEPMRVQPDMPQSAHEGTPYLDRYGRDLTQAAREGKLGPFIGRRQ